MQRGVTVTARRTAPVALVLVAALGLAACHGGGHHRAASGPATRASTTTVDAAPLGAASYTSAIAHAIGFAVPTRDVSARDVSCVAAGIVGAVGTTTLRALGATPTQIRDRDALPRLVRALRASQADRVATVLQRCLPFGQLVASDITAKYPAVTVTAAERACLDRTTRGSVAIHAALASQFSRTGAARPPDFAFIAGECVRGVDFKSG